MRWQDIFNTPIAFKTTRVRGEARPVAAEAEVASGVFITPQSLVTFPVATATISVIWKSIGALWPSLGNSLWVPATACVIFGAFLYYVAISDSKANPTKRDKVIGVAVAVVNSFYLFASSVGIISALALAPGSS